MSDVQTDTSSQDQIPGTAQRPKSGAPPMQLKRLREYLDSAYPYASLPGEATVDTAIRLMQGLTAQPGAVAEKQAYVRCSQEYCNLPIDHQSEHGWVNYQ